MRKNTGSGWGGLLGLLLLIAGGCSREESRPATASSAEEGIRTYLVTGIVEELRLDENTVVVDHQEIPGYMAAMRMPFDVKDSNEISNLEPGEEIHFRMLVSETDGWIDQVRKTGVRVSRSRSTAGAPRQVRLVEPLAVGDPLPDYTFTNQWGAAFRLEQFRGQALALSFIFTRCPYPDFCPRMTGNLADAARQLQALESAPTNWHLVSLSFDVEHDTPQVLKAYAEKQGYDPERWTFATGALMDVDAITEQFGLVFGREGSFFNHNLRTVVIDAQGRVQKVFTGNSWPVEDLVAEMVQAAGAAGVSP